MKYTLSVIVPAYNSEKTIAQTLDSLLKQKSTDLEIIIVNDGSTDDTEAICREYCNSHENVKYFIKNNSGVSETRNLGIERASGEYVCFLDSDDVWDDNYYDDVLHSQLNNTDYDIFVFSSCFSDMDLNVKEYVKVNDALLVEQKDRAVDMYYHSFCSFIFKKSFLTNNALKFNENIRYGEDELFRSQCLYLAKTVFAQDKLSFYYRDNVFSSTKMRRNQKLFAKQKLEVYYLMKEFFFEQYEKESLSRMVRNATTAKYLVHAIALLSETGVGLKKIKKLCEQEKIQELALNAGKEFKLHSGVQAELEKIVGATARFYYKHRFHGLWYNTALFVKHKIIGHKNRRASK